MSERTDANQRRDLAAMEIEIGNEYSRYVLSCEPGTELPIIDYLTQQLIAARRANPPPPSPPG